MKKDDRIELRIEDMSVDGSGIGKLDGMAFFVKDALIGDRVSAKIMKLKKTYGYARLMELLEPSPYRVEPKCPLHRRCGGCQIQALSYEKQLEFKENKIRSSLERIGGFAPEEIPMQPIIGMEDIYHYRNKAQFPVGRDKNGKLAAGFYASRTHSIIPVEDCQLGVTQNQEIMQRILAWMEQYKIEPYDEKNGTGLVRHVLIRAGFYTKQLMVCLVIHGQSLPKAEPLIDELAQIEGMTGISISVNEQRGNVIMGETVKTLWGADYIEDFIGSGNQDRNEKGRESGNDSESANEDGNKGVKFQISPLSFYQVNPVQTEKLYEKVLEYAGLHGEETVWDLYCGIGTIALFLAQKAKRVYGVEIVPQAVEDARRNARINNITNAEFFAGKAEEVLPRFYGQRSAVPEEADGAGAGIKTGAEGNIKAGVKTGAEGDIKAGIRTGAEGGIKADIETVGAKEQEDLNGNLQPQVVVVDPPRKGCEESLLRTIVQLQPQRVVYVSCDPATLARDLKYLCGCGYELKGVQGVDLFCHTVHVETVCLLSKLYVEHHIEVEVNLDEMDLTAAESKAAYEEIKGYVKEKMGLHVSNLYIAQVKRKCGIIERENYNKAKSEDAIQPKCPPEKEEAIMAALKYFRMV